MKKTFTITAILMLAMFIAGSLSAQTQIFHEHFEDSTGVSDIGWTAIDEDGDGNNWVMNVYNSEIYMASESWDGQNPLTPENYLITPEIDLTGYDSLSVEYFVATATSSTYYEEHYKFVVAVGNDVASVNSGTIIHEETMGPESVDGNWQQRSFDLSDYIGQSIYLAWVHYNCTDEYKLLLDSVSVFEHPIKITEIDKEVDFKVSPNPVNSFTQATFSLKEKSNVSYTIHDITGRVVAEREIGAMTGTNTIDINTATLTNGIYYMRLKHNDMYSVTKFVKQ